MESIYVPRLNSELRKKRRGLRPAEAISLADSGLSIREFVQVFKAMIKLAMQYHARRGGDCWTITVNPRHSSFYQKVLGFASLGPRRRLPQCPGPPRRGLRPGLRLDGRHAPAMYEYVFGV